MTQTASMSFNPPDSTLASRISYNPNDRVLSVTFKTGGTHHFADVPLSHYQGIQAAKSVGGYFHANIKGKYGPAE